MVPAPRPGSNRRRRDRTPAAGGGDKFAGITDGRVSLGARFSRRSPRPASPRPAPSFPSGSPRRHPRTPKASRLPRTPIRGGPGRRAGRLTEQRRAAPRAASPTADRTRPRPDPGSPSASGMTARRVSDSAGRMTAAGRGRGARCFSRFLALGSRSFALPLPPCLPAARSAGRAVRRGPCGPAAGRQEREGDL